MSLLDKGHPIGFLFNREFNNVIPSLDSIVDASFDKAKNLYRKNLLAHYGCVNAIEFSNDGRLLVSGGDDRRVLVWDMQKAIHSCMEPFPMAAEHNSNIFALAVDYRSSRIFSGGNDDQVIVHDAVTGTCLDYFVHEQPVYGISTDPQNDNVFASACDDGRILVYDIREPAVTEPFCLATTTAAFHSVMYNPSEPRLLVSANFKKGIALWDIRMPKRCLLKYGGTNAHQCCMSARFNRTGTRILALRKRLPPVLYATESTPPVLQFNHTGYYNSCTMKSCCFAGTNDEFVMSGSDNFDLYIWKIPPTPPPPRPGGKGRYIRHAHLVLQGHRSIVNQVRYNHAYSVIASSGVEKLIKLWSPFSLPSSHDGKSSYKLRGDIQRHIYSHDDYINLIMHSGQFMSLTYDTSRRNTKEDPRMMAFFDALVQRDISGMSDEEMPTKKISYTNTAISFSSASSNGEDEPEPDPESESDTSENNGESPNELIVAEFPDPDPISRSNVSTSSDSSSEDEDQARIRRIRRQEVLPGTENGSNEIGPQPLNHSPESGAESGSGHEDRQSNPAVVMPNDNSLGESSSDSAKHNFNSTAQPSTSNSTSISPPVNDDEGDEGTPKPERNIITQMIAARNDQLLNLAKTHMVEEYERKATLRKLRRDQEDKSGSSSSSSSSSSNDPSSSDSELDDMFANLKKKIKPFLWKKKHPVGNEKERSRNKIRKLINKYNSEKPKKKVPHQSSSNHNGLTNGVNTGDENRPCTSSSLTYNKRLNPSTSKSVPSYSKDTRIFLSSTSSDSDSDSPSPPAPEPSRKKARNHSFEVTGKKCDKRANDKNEKTSSSDSSRSGSQNNSANEDESKKSSLAYRLSPLIRRIDNERGNQKQLTKRSRRAGTETESSSSDTDTGKAVPKKRMRNENTVSDEMEIPEKDETETIKTDSEKSSEEILVIENDIRTDVPQGCDGKTTNGFATQDSGIELSRNEVELEIEDDSKSNSTSEAGKAVTVTGTGNGIRSLICMTDLDSEEGKDKTPCAFKKSELSKTKNRHYRGHKSDSD